tara:strand:+ start:1009 stop:1266 length:258 start_codon:yes stop_codon:yes gene_type:complete
MIILNAILKINPNAKVAIKGSDIDTCEITWTDTEEISREDIKAMIPVVEQEKADAETQKETDASTGKQKLKDLGLTDAEIKALIG